MNSLFIHGLTLGTGVRLEPKTYYAEACPRGGLTVYTQPIPREIRLTSMRIKNDCATCTSGATSLAGWHLRPRGPCTHIDTCCQIDEVEYMLFGTRIKSHAGVPQGFKAARWGRTEEYGKVANWMAAETIRFKS